MECATKTARSPSESPTMLPSSQLVSLLPRRGTASLPTKEVKTSEMNSRIKEPMSCWDQLQGRSDDLRTAEGTGKGSLLILI